jgi:hypothetical protein
MISMFPLCLLVGVMTLYTNPLVMFGRLALFIYDLFLRNSFSWILLDLSMAVCPSRSLAYMSASY